MSRSSPYPDSHDHGFGLNSETVRGADSLLKAMRWLKPTNLLKTLGGASFGRQIERHLRSLREDGGVISIKLRNEEAAVVMSPEHYAEVIAMREMYQQLIEGSKTELLNDLGQTYTHLYAQMQSAEAKAAGDALFAMNDTQLSQHYKPGRTETKT